MGFQSMRLALVGLASATLLLLGACGSGKIESQLKPSRVIVFGDAFSDAGQTPGAPGVANAKYTVNDGSLNWAQIVAANYGLTITPAVLGGTVYATGNARVTAAPDAAGSGATRTIEQQINDFFSAGNTLGEDDLVLINGGFSDIIVEMAAVTSQAQTPDQMRSNVRQAAHELAAQAKRLVAAGGKHVVVVGVYELGKTPWAAFIGQQDLLNLASAAFNRGGDDENDGDGGLLGALADQGGSPQKVLYIDGQFQLNNILNNPSAYGFDNVTERVCTSFDAGQGIGIGPDRVNSKLCTPATIVPGADYTRYLFADEVYPTPTGHARFGDYAFTRIRSIW